MNKQLFFSKLAYIDHEGIEDYELFHGWVDNCDHRPVGEVPVLDDTPILVCVGEQGQLFVVDREWCVTKSK